MNPLAWLKSHKPEAALGVGGIGVTVFLALRARNNASGSSSSTGSTTTGGALPISTADTTSSDAFNGIENQVLGLQQAVLGISNPSAPAAPVAAAAPAAPTDPFAGEVFGGSGFGAPTGGLEVTAGSGQFTEFTDPNAAGAYARGGGSLFFQPTEGIFAADTSSSNLAPGTPLFAKDASS